MLIRVIVLCHISYSIVSYLYLIFNGLITSVGEERESLFLCYRLLVFMWFLFGRFPVPLGAWDSLHYLMWHSMGLPYNIFRKELCVVD